MTIYFMICWMIVILIMKTVKWFDWRETCLKLSTRTWITSIISLQSPASSECFVPPVREIGTSSKFRGTLSPWQRYITTMQPRELSSFGIPAHGQFSRGLRQMELWMLPVFKSDFKISLSLWTRAKNIHFCIIRSTIYFLRAIESQFQSISYLRY